ncbi:TPA: hypothetical protein NO241_005049 [Escherichia coli]|nr:hypothetical protein [Escherichia coli]EHN0527155.1 hypothetical protein [Salmonella enterica]HDT0319272.1 hypothetical protein [Citrobacter amalonaticus]EHS5555339.1 hypothetical protein [Escherichia coli]EIF6766174.1 hypothetical protein [Escherichia coli]
MVGVSLDIENYCTLRLLFNQSLVLDKVPEYGKPAARSICCFSNAEFFYLSVVQHFLMPFLIGLFSPVFTQRMSSFNSLFLALATTQPVLMRHRGHQVYKHIIYCSYHCAGKLSHLSPLGWEHINLTGDYIWKNNRIPTSGKFRRLRPVKIDKVKKQP